MLGPDGGGGSEDFVGLMSSVVHLTAVGVVVVGEEVSLGVETIIAKRILR